MDRWDWTCLLSALLIAGGFGWWVHPGAGLVAFGAAACWLSFQAAATRQSGRAQGGG